MTEPNTMQIRATWVEGLQFVGLGLTSGTTVAMDTGHNDGTPRQGTSPMEMLLMGVAGCTGMDVAVVLKKKRERVTRMYINVTGHRRTEHPMCFYKVETEFVVRGYGVSREAVERAVTLSREKYCSVINSLNAEISSSIVIEEEPEPEAK